MTGTEAFKRRNRAGLSVCAASGCGKRFEPSRGNQRFCSTKCRVEQWWRRHPRQPATPKRPRSARAHHGAEFQLSLEDIAYIQQVRERENLANGSEALRYILATMWGGGR